MTITELNEYIKHYLEEDKTKSAIMLNAPWGTGKSYYIQNTLREFLKKNGKDRCVIVSLYGMKELSDISKSLYFELRVKPVKTTFSKMWKKVFKGKEHKHTSEVANTIVGGGKTTIKGVTSYFGVDIGSTDKSLQKIYESIDLTDKLIILEDIERSNIGILSLMGYINNLVEQEGVRVMLVANEDEIIKKVPVEAETKEKEEKIEGYHSLGLDNRPYTEESKAYLKTKEKTISDTINFEGDYRAAIKNIISSFKNDTLSTFLEEQSVIELERLLQKKNLRSFIFACQKTVDIYNYITSVLETGYIKAIFFGMVIYSLKIKAGKENSWDGDSNLSTTLGNGDYPLFKFCYNYIWQQKIETNDIVDGATSFKELRLYNRHQARSDSDLNAIYNFYVQTEDELVSHLDNIKNRLNNPDDISYYEYGKLASYIVSLTEFINYDINPIKKLIIKNLTGMGNKINEYFLFHSSTKIDSEEKTKEYEELKNKMIQVLKENQDVLWGFDYKPESANKLYTASIDFESDIRNNGKFVSLFDMDKLFDFLQNCTAAQLENVRGAFLTVYRYQYIKDHFANEKDTMEVLLSGVENIIQNNSDIDRIQKLQLKWFRGNLKSFIERL
jgi:hypothetical protein